MQISSRGAGHVNGILQSTRGRVFRSILRALVIFLVGVNSGVCEGQFPDFSNPPPATKPRRTKPNTRPNTTPAQKPKPANAQASKFLAPEVITQKTKDGVTLTCTWFGQKVAPPDQPTGQRPRKDVVDGRQVVPFILLHDWDRSREDLLLLGRYLQLAGHAAIVPDLRGHGDSLEVEGSTKRLDRDRFRKQEIPAIMGDFEACKKFLMRKNDDGELNIDLLNVVAVGGTGVLATQWAISDWSWAPVGSIKQGQDVKSVTLIAPEKKFKGLSLVKNLKHPLYVGGPNDPLPLLVVYPSQNVDVAKEGKEIYEAVKKTRSKYARVWGVRQQELAARERDQPAAPEKPADGVMGGGEVEEEKPVDLPAIGPMKTLVSGPVPGSTKSGAAMIADPQAEGVWRFVDNFVKQTVLSRRAASKWQQRLK